MKKMAASIRNLSVNLDLPQCDLPDNVLTKAINFTTVNGKLVTTKMSVQAPVNTSGWLPLPGSGVITNSQILHLSFDAASMDDTALNPDVLNKWAVTVWDLSNAPEYVPVASGSSDLAVTNCVFYMDPTIQPEQLISLVVTLKTTILDNELIQDTSNVNIVSVDADGKIVYATTTTIGSVAVNTYFTLLFQLDIDGMTQLYLKDGESYTLLGELYGILNNNIEFNTPWGRPDRRTMYVSDVAGYKGHIV